MLNPSPDLNHFMTFPVFEANQEDTLKGKTQINRVIYTLNSSLGETTAVVCFSGNCNFHWFWPFGSHTHTQKLCLKSKEVSYTDKWRKKIK